ncbi:MAG: YegS/Rv2252/BmrU family lipid kinase [Leptolyngbyaceae cyanobacterium bins.59]|nr:YegS/Rv2252/BmrU family lipid kinase [Leptolyngbyaceae cyanobacterium bins.59]
MLRSACLIFNPVAGNSNPEVDLATIQAFLEPEIDLDVRLTTEEVDADQLAREAVERGVEAVIASGGDGTLSAAATALIGTDIPLGIISRGTANAFATALGLPDTLEEACQTILGGATQVVDAAYCNDRPMILLAGIGFEAETVERASREIKTRLGMLAYIVAGVDQLRNYELFDVEIETDDQIVRTSAAAVTVANAAPPTSILAQGPAKILFDDGLLDLTIVASVNRVGAITASYNLLQSALRGDAIERDDVGYLRAKRVKIITDPPQKVAVDGEIIGTTPVEITCIPGGLRIFTPQTEKEELVQKLDGLPNLEIVQKEASDEESDWVQRE